MDCYWTELIHVQKDGKWDTAKFTDVMLVRKNDMATSWERHNATARHYCLTKIGPLLPR